MVVRDILEILEGEIICEGDLDQEIKTACGSDMASFSVNTNCSCMWHKKFSTFCTTCSTLDILYVSTFWAFCS